MRLLDIGNTFTRIADEKNGVIDLGRVVRTADLTAADLPEAEPVAACCVVPAVKARLKTRNIFYLDAANAGGRVDFGKMDGSTLGADRVANAVALAELFPLPALCVDCGTAVTIEVVDENRVFRGGAIAPGRMLMRHALSTGTAQLPDIPFSSELPEKVGENTAESIRFGVDRGAFGMVSELIRATIRQFRRNNGEMTVVFTGGDAAFFAGCREGSQLAPAAFTLTGLFLCAKDHALL